MELMSLENRGITIWLEGYPSTSATIANQLCAHEENSYMRDYVFDKGVLKELHFNKIDNGVL